MSVITRLQRLSQDRKSRRRVAITALVACCALLLSACGSSSVPATPRPQSEISKITVQNAATQAVMRSSISSLLALRGGVTNGWTKPPLNTTAGIITALNGTGTYKFQSADGQEPGQVTVNRLSGGEVLLATMSTSYAQYGASVISSPRGSLIRRCSTPFLPLNVWLKPGTCTGGWDNNLAVVNNQVVG